MHPPFAAAPAMPAEWLFGIGSVLIGGAVLPFLLSVLIDAVALGVQRRRWRLLVGLLAAVGATDGALSWTLSLARAPRAAYDVEWPHVVALLFGVGMVVALWHGIPRVMRSVLRRRGEDRERADRAAAVREPGSSTELFPLQPTAPAAAPEVAAPEAVVLDPAPQALVLAD
jgi:hypothetical protein